MPKFVADAVLDGALNVVRTSANLMVALPSQPADFAAAQAAKLAEVAMVAGDYTIADGATSGRRVTVAAKTTGNAIAAGTINHVALLDTTGSRLLYVTTCPAQAIVLGGPANVGAWDIEIRDPA